jgi:hypothetical protein
MSSWAERVARAEAEIAAIKSGEWHGFTPNERNMRRLNVKLNASETMLRLRIGSPKADALIRQFKTAAVDDPKLFKALYAKRDPYHWIFRHWARQPPIPQPQPPGGAP